ncbi:MAG: glycosyltransferase [Lentisphaeria bacterium]|jgi:glycosyltransferase involved in cell wall biosynthesis
MYHPLVTIITPTYKHDAYIGECIESVLGQTYGKWEQIIVDDCSPDRTLEIAQSYRDPRIRVIQKPVRGGPEKLHESYNMALGMARGELIAVLEGDDYWPKNKLEIQVPFHASPSLAMTWGNYEKKMGDRLLGAERRYSRKPITFPNTSYLLIRNVIPALTVMAPREALLKIGGFWQPEGTVFVDHPTWLKLSRVGNILYIPRRLGIYRLHGGQISRNQRQKMCAFSHAYIDEFISALSPEEKRELAMRKIAASRALYKATKDMMEEGRLNLPLLVRAFLGGDLRTKYQCIQTVLAMARRRIRPAPPSLP